MRVFGLLLLSVLFFTGCTTVQVANYIPGDHPYSKNLYGDRDRIVSVVQHVLNSNGWRILKTVRPSEYERPEAGAKDDQDLLIFTEVRQHSMVLYSSYTHLNVFIRVIADGATVEIRYGKLTPLFIKQFTSSRNDKLVNRLLKQMERELVENE